MRFGERSEDPLGVLDLVSEGKQGRFGCYLFCLVAGT